MKCFEISSYQLLQTQKWASSGTLFEMIDGGKVNIQEGDVFSPEFRFNTREEADDFFREYFLQKGYIENNLFI